jgi:hypothetical protein
MAWWGRWFGWLDLEEFEGKTIGLNELKFPSQTRKVSVSDLQHENFLSFFIISSPYDARNDPK